MRSLIIIAACLTFFSVSAYAASPYASGEPKNTFGAAHLTHAGGKYTLIENSETATATGPSIGVVFFYERLFLSRFSSSIRYTSFMERSLQTTNGTHTNDIQETTSITGIDFKSYFKDHTRPGTKIYMAVGYSIYAVKSSITTTPTSGDTTTGSTSASIPVTTLGIGVDYIFDYGGVRAELDTASGKRDVLDTSKTYQASYNMAGTVVTIGVFAFF